MKTAVVPSRLAARLGVSPVALLGFSILGVIVANTVAQVRLNRWNGDFYGAIEARDYPTFIDQLLVFSALAAVLLVLVVAQTWLTEIAKVRLREEATNDLLDGWLQPHRPFELNLAGEIGVNPDQRLQEDVRRWSELSVNLAAGLAQSSLLLVTFVGVLWSISVPLEIHVFGTTFAIPGLMLWGALGFSAAGSALTWWIGAPLIRLHQLHYAREAEFRSAIVRATEAAQEIAFQRGEGRERLTIAASFARTTAVMTDLAGAVARLTSVTSGYGWLGIVAPAVVAAPSYFSGALTFGELMMVVQAFYQVQQALRWFVDNYPAIADWKAARARVDEFRDALADVAQLHADQRRITVRPHPEGELRFVGLRVRLPDGDAMFQENVVAIGKGERVLIVGEAGAGKSMLFRAMAGLWPWGTGTIDMPPLGDTMFLSQRPYLPMGDLRSALSYPEPPGRWSDAELVAALERVSLGGYAASIGVSKRWDRELTIEEQQQLAFARVLLRRPHWIFLDEAASACAEDHRATIIALLKEDLRDAAVVGLAREPQTNGLFARTVRMRRRAAPKLHLSLPPDRRSPAPQGSEASAGTVVPSLRSEALRP